MIPHVLVAPGPFKGALGAAAAAAAIGRGLSASAGVTVRELPVADGGQGTLDALIEAVDGQRREVVVSDPLGRDVRGHWGLLPGEVAMIELAQASGFERLAEAERDPERTTTFGTGQMILAALEAGVREILIGVGGSATNDGGLGALRALGVHLRSDDGDELAGCGADLARLAQVDLSGIDPRIAKTRLRVVADVDNPLCGPTGAASVFGPQKGADAAAVARLDAGLARLGEIIARDHGRDVLSLAGAGAAGGAAGGLAGLVGAEIAPGADLVLDAVGFDAALEGADLCITGEGALDLQTAAGKAPAAVAERCRARGIPCVALSGRNDLSASEAREMGFAAALAIGRMPRPLSEAMAMTASDLESAGGALGGILSAVSGR